MPAHQELRQLTAADHEAIDARFSGFDLSQPSTYRAFLRAHARAVPAVETALVAAAGPPPLRPRAQLLAKDLGAFDEAMPAALDLARPVTTAEAWGMAYVLEGSRLGGVMLARDVPPDLPRAYLADGHLSGEWRSFTRAMDEAVTGDDALAEAAAGARRVFALYGEAAAAEERAVR